MPMSFPNMQSLKDRAQQRNFRQPEEDETEENYRAEFARFMRNVDIIEAMEIADGRGWDEQDPLKMFMNITQP